MKQTYPKYNPPVCMVTFNPVLWPFATQEPFDIGACGDVISLKVAEYVCASINAAGLFKYEAVPVISDAQHNNYTGYPTDPALDWYYACLKVPGEVLGTTNLGLLGQLAMEQFKTGYGAPGKWIHDPQTPSNPMMLLFKPE